jgi:AcrR family transcriptional regulator
MICKSGRYHHGDLHDALIVATAEIIEEGASLGFTIADVARRAGVSSAALYRHFKDKEALLTAVRDLAFVGLDHSMRAALSSTQRGTVDQVTALGLAYLHYAQAKRAFFSLMWEARGDMVQRRAEARLKATGFTVLTTALEDCMAAGILPPATDSTHLATQLWSMAHGVSTLALNQMLDVFDTGVTGEQLIREATRCLFRGLRHADDALLSNRGVDQLTLTLV